MALQPSPTLPNIRYRSRSGLKPFDPNWDAQSLFPAAEAKHDRVEVSTSWLLPVSTTHFDEFTSSLDGHDGISANPFRISQISALTRKIETIRPWSFSATGKLTCWQNSNITRTEIVFSLNPTRWLAYQPNPDAAMEAGDPSHVLQLDGQRMLYLKSLTLDQNDNFLPSARHLGGETFRGRADWWRVVLEHYTGMVRSLVESSFQAVVPPQFEGYPERIPLPPLVFETPTQAEVYWELIAPLSATGIVCRLGEVVRRMDGQAHTFQVIDQGGDANAEWLKLGLTDTIALKVYAKSRDRIRFEITYNKNIGQLGFPPHATIVDKLMRLSEDAARRVQRFWRGIAPVLRETPGYGDLLTFMGKLNRHVPTDNIPIILELLAYRRVLARTGPAGAAPANVCRALVGAGIIEKTGLRSRSKTYRLAPEYQRMFDEMTVAGHFLNPVFTS